MERKSFLTRNFYIFNILFAIGVILSNDMFLPAMSVMSSELGIGLTTMQLGITAWLVGSMVVQLFGGPISDSFGRKKVMLFGAVIAVIGSVGCIFAFDTYSFIAFRLLQGGACGAATTAGISMVLDYYESQKAATILAMMTNVIILAPIAGPIIGAYILKFASWEYIFIIDAVLLAFTFLAMLFFMPETLEKEKRAEWNGLMTPVKLLHGMSKDFAFLSYCLSGGVTMLLLMLLVTGMPILLMTNNGLNSTEYALYQIPVFALFIAGNIVATILIQKFTLKQILDVSHELFFVVGIVVIAFGYLFDISWQIMLVAFAVVFFVNGLLNAPKTNYALAIPKHYVGTATTFYNFTGTILGTAMSIGATLLPGQSNGTPLIILGVGAIVACLLAYIGDSILSKRETLAKDNVSENEDELVVATEHKE